MPALPSQRRPVDVVEQVLARCAVEHRLDLAQEGHRAPAGGQAKAVDIALLAGPGDPDLRARTSSGTVRDYGVLTDARLVPPLRTSCPITLAPRPDRTTLMTTVELGLVTSGDITTDAVTGGAEQRAGGEP